MNKFSILKPIEQKYTGEFQVFIKAIKQRKGHTVVTQPLPLQKVLL